MTQPADVESAMIQAGYSASPEYVDKGFDHVFTCKSVVVIVQWFETVKSMSEIRLRQQNLIASEIQRGLKGNNKWDIYLLLITKEAITEETLKSVEDIQNDTFCCRKIVVEGTSKSSLLSGLGQLPFIMPSQGREQVVSSVRDFFIRQFGQHGIAGDLVGNLLGKMPDEVADVLVRHVSAKTK